MQLRPRWNYNLNSLETHFLIFQLFLCGKLLITYVLIEAFDEHPLIDCLWNGIGSFSSRGSLQRCFVKDVFLEISQTSQENTCTRVSFLIKFQEETLAQVFSCEFCEISKNNFFSQNTSGGFFWSSVMASFIILLDFLKYNLFSFKVALNSRYLGSEWPV